MAAWASWAGPRAEVRGGDEGLPAGSRRRPCAGYATCSLKQRAHHEHQRHSRDHEHAAQAEAPAVGGGPRPPAFTSPERLGAGREPARRGREEGEAGHESRAPARPGGGRRTAGSRRCSERDHRAAEPVREQRPAAAPATARSRLAKAGARCGRGGLMASRTATSVRALARASRCSRGSRRRQGASPAVPRSAPAGPRSPSRLSPVPAERVVRRKPR